MRMSIIMVYDQILPCQLFNSLSSVNRKLTIACLNRIFNDTLSTVLCKGRGTTTIKLAYFDLINQS